MPGQIFKEDGIGKRGRTTTVKFWPPLVVSMVEWSYRLYHTPAGKYPLVEFAPLLSTGVISSASPALQPMPSHPGQAIQ